MARSIHAMGYLRGNTSSGVVAQLAHFLLENGGEVMIRDRTLRARVTAEQEEKLQEVAKQLGVSPAAVLRQLVDRATVEPALGVKELEGGAVGLR